MPSPRLVLASASPRRIDLLRSAGYDPVVEPAGVDETPDPALRPAENAARFAREKAEAISTRHAGELDRPLVLGADTIVVLDDELLGKPAGAGEARDMLERLSGRVHEVVTCVHLTASREHAPSSLEVRTEVSFRALDAADVEDYLASGEWEGKAGSYAIQGRAAAFARSVIGSYTNVVGLPLCEVVEALRERGHFGIGPRRLKR